MEILWKLSRQYLQKKERERKGRDLCTHVYMCMWNRNSRSHRKWNNDKRTLQNVMNTLTIKLWDNCLHATRGKTAMRNDEYTERAPLNRNCKYTSQLLASIQLTCVAKKAFNFHFWNPLFSSFFLLVHICIGKLYIKYSTRHGTTRFTIMKWKWKSD
jgi:hypothetical protein